MIYYLVTRCLRRGTPRRLYPYSVGDVELRSAQSDMEQEREAIRQSLIAYGETAVEPDMSAVRASTIAGADNAGAAFALATLRIDEAIDVLASANPMPAFSAYRLMEAGCTRDLTTGRVMPLLPRIAPDQFDMWGSVLLMDQYTWPARDFTQHVLSTERGELGECYARAAHWSRKADLESNPHLAMLFEWFAAESIWNFGKNDDVIPPIRWSLGFPNGKGIKLLGSATQQAINSDAMHSVRSGRIEARLHRIRSLRNQIVHNGFRQVDVPADELRWLRVLSHLAARYALHCVEQGLYAALYSTADLVEYLPLLLEPGLHATSKHVVERIQSANTLTSQLM
jgi:hypothetical protein